MTALLGLVVGMFLGIAIRELWSLWRRKRGDVAMHPNPSSERAPLQGRPISHSDNPCIENPTEAVADIQARSLRRRFTLGYCVAAALAPLVWGLPR